MNPTRNPAAIALLVLAPAAAGSSAQESELRRESFTMRSSLLAEDRAIHVDVPEACSDEPCPVAVVLDAELVFPVAAGVQHLLSHRFVRRSAPAIVVGVESTDRLRDTTPTATERFPTGGGAGRFLRFLVDELVPEVERRYATDGRRVLIGHSGSGLVALQAAIRSADTFGGIAAIDPSVDWDEGVILGEVREWLAKGGPGAPLHLLVDTYRLKPAMGDLVRILGGAPETLEWSSKVHEGETHQTLLVPALQRALPVVLPPPGA